MIHRMSAIKNILGGDNSNVFHVHPETWGFMIHFEEYMMFQMGWFNHQLANYTFHVKEIGFAFGQQRCVMFSFRRKRT